MCSQPCDRYGCTNFMCERYGYINDELFYICESCFRELVSLGTDVNVEAFMDRQEVESAFDYWDNVFAKG